MYTKLLFLIKQSEHQGIRDSKEKDEYLNLEDYRKMEFTQHVSRRQAILLYLSPSIGVMSVIN